MDEHLIADFENLRALAEFAYEQGFHELGYDPVAFVANEMERLQWLIENGERHFGTLWRQATVADIDAVRRSHSAGAEQA